MKLRKLLIFILTLCVMSIASIFIFTACGKTDSSNSTDNSPNSSTDNSPNNSTDNSPNNSTDDKHTHDYADTVTPPTCIERGYTSHVCKECDYEYIDTFIDPLGHDIRQHGEKAATCKETGWNAYQTCSRCDYSTKVETPKSTQHTYTDGVCEVCNEPEPPTLNLLNFILKDDGTFEVAAIEKSVTKVIIPSSFNERVVTAIAESAFRSCSLLATVIIPDSVTKIGDYAFYECGSLTSITIPDSVTKIGDYAFYGCASLTSITIPENVTKIGDSCFNNCTSLERVNWEAVACSSAGGAFKDCPKLTEINFSDNVIKIPEYAFYASTIKSITIPDSVTSIGSCAFKYSSLKSITIPDNVTSIGDEAFARCGSLESITVGANNPEYKSIDGNLYTKDGKTLMQYAIGKEDTSFKIPSGVTRMDNEAFAGCIYLERLIIPISVTYIGFAAFRHCPSNLTIYCEATERPSGWDWAWNLISADTMKYFTVVWGYTGD